MASPRGIRAGAAYVELFISDSKLVRGLQNAARRLRAFGTTINQWGQSLAKVGAAIAGPLAASTKVFTQMGDRLAKMSGRTGISVETLSELGYAADLSGADIDTLEASIRRMQRSTSDALDGLATATDAFAKLNLKVQDLSGLTPDQQFKLIADRLAAIKSPSLKAAIAMELFGRSGTRLLPMLAGGAAGIEALQKQARDLGLTMSGEDAKAAEVLNDAMDTLWKTVKQGVFVMGSELAPLMLSLAERITNIVVATTDWIRKNKALVVLAFKVGVAILAAGVALIVLGYSLIGFGAAFGALATVLTGIAAAFGAIGAAIAWLVTPMGLVTAAAVALGGYLLYASGIGGKALAWLAGKFRELWAFASEAFGGIADALAAGDISLAAQILWLSLRVAWLKGVEVLEKAWLTFKHTFIRIAYGAFFGAQAAWETGVHAMTVAWIEGVAVLKKVWANFTSWHATTVETTANWMAKRWIELQGLFDDTIDVQWQKSNIDQQSQQQFGNIERERKGAVNEAEQTRASSRQAASQMHESNMKDIGEKFNQADERLKSEYDQKTKAAQEDLEKARAEWRSAIDEARKKRELSDAKGPERIGSKRGIIDDLEGLGDVIKEKAKSIAVSGTFSAVEASRFGGNSVTDRIAKATEDTAKHTKRLVDKADDGGLAFE